MNTYVGVPLKARGKAFGVIGFYARERLGFTDDEIELITTLGGQAALAIENSRVHQRLKAANDALEKTLEIKSALVGVMAHELKTPIQIILGTAELLATGLCGELNNEQLERVKAIEVGGNELLELIKSALDMARLEHGRMPLRVTEVWVGELLAELGSESQGGFREKGLELEVGPVASGLMMRTDRVKLKEVLRNLLDNALKFTLRGKVTLGVVEGEGDTVEFIVSDTGVGIQSEHLPKIFDMFYQVDSTDSAAAGLGLNIVKRLITAMSGQIDVNSEPGHGTTFRIRLPKQIS